jgi:hypothetical protein
VTVICAQRDTICPPPAAKALLYACGAAAQDQALLEAPGGHIGAVDGAAAPKAVYPILRSWLRQRLC